MTACRCGETTCGPDGAPRFSRPSDHGPHERIRVPLRDAQRGDRVGSAERISALLRTRLSGLGRRGSGEFRPWDTASCGSSGAQARGPAFQPRPRLRALRAPRNVRLPLSAGSTNFCGHPHVPGNQRRTATAEARGAHPRVLARARGLPSLPRAAQGRGPLHLLRGPADRQRAPGHPPRPRPHAEGRHLPLPRPQRPARRAQGRAGTPTGCRSRSRSRSPSGIHGKEAIRDYGIEAFTRRCIDSVFTYVEEWERLTDRIGYWLDLPEAYVTYHESYVGVGVVVPRRALPQGACSTRATRSSGGGPRAARRSRAGEVGLGYRDVDRSLDHRAVPLARGRARRQADLASWPGPPPPGPCRATCALAVGAGPRLRGLRPRRGGRGGRRRAA